MKQTAGLEKLDGSVISVRLWYMIKMMWTISLGKGKKDDDAYTSAQDRIRKVQDDLARARIANARMNSDLLHMYKILKLNLESKAPNNPQRILKHTHSWHNLLPQGTPIAFNPSLDRSMPHELIKPSPNPTRKKPTRKSATY
ncbi:hypothetical protein DSO57_1001213 [Entomophthora muscae]|uniref:Uncharacterized protein n=1 Tax=Entomophthora muscae TaxID=34485 RepID=A0ACC2TW60_9FUNG|nr:hypothetical protein DSO57_1001213 [Entomophthora muscae]